MGLFDQFPYTNFHEMNQDWLLQVCKQLAEDMATVQTEWTDTKDYIDNYFKNLDIDDEIKDAILYQVEQMATDGTLDEIVSRVVSRELPEYSAPVFVSGTSGMTDNKKVYVNTSNGHIYAYNGTAFYDTGLSYAFDSSLVINNSAVLADNTDLNFLTQLNTMYYLSSDRTYTNKPSYMPAGILLVYSAGATTTQIAISSTGTVVERYKISDAAWSSWAPMRYGYGRSLVNGDDLDNITDPGVYVKPGSSSLVVNNLPGQTRQEYFAIIYVFLSGNTTIQTYISASGTDYAHFIATRYLAGSTWSAWRNIGYASYGLLPSGTDINSVIQSGWYYIDGSTGYVYTNMPADITTGHAAFLEVMTYNNIITQRMTKWSDGITCIRSSANAGSTWRDWRAVAGKEVGGGGLSSKQYIAFGDSITWSSVWSNGTTTQAAYDDRIPTRVGSAVGIPDTINMGVSNIGYLAQSGGETILDVIERTDISNAALITLACGRNDSNYSLTQIISAIQACINYIKSQNKSTQIVIVQPTPHNQTDGEIAFTETVTGGWSLDSFEAAAKELAEDTGCGYAGWRDCSLVWSWASFSGDRGNYAHLNASWLYGMLGAYLGGKVSQFFKM